MPWPTRRLVAALVAAGLTVGAGGCGNGSGSGAGDGPPTVGLVVPALELNFAREMVDGFTTAVGGIKGVTPVVDGPQSVDHPRELAQFSAMAERATGGIAVCTLAAPVFAPAMAATRKSGVPVVAVDNPPAPGADVDLFIGNDNYRLGTLLADQIIDALPADAAGAVVIGNTTPGTRVLDLRARGIRDEFHARLPKARVLGPFDTKQDVPANLAAWTSLVKANPTALAFIGTGDADGWHLAGIRAQTHGIWQAGAFDLDARALRAVRDGQLVLVSPEHFLKGAVAGRLLARAALDEGKLPAGWLQVPGLVVNRANVAEVIARQTSASTRASWFAREVDAMVADPGRYLRKLSDAG